MEIPISNCLCDCLVFSLAVLRCMFLSQIAGSERKRSTFLQRAQQLTGPSIVSAEPFPS